MQNLLRRPQQLSVQVVQFSPKKSGLEKNSNFRLKSYWIVECNYIKALSAKFCLI